MGSVPTRLEKAHLMLASAQRIRTIADGLFEEHHRSLLHTIANEVQQQAKQAIYRAERDLEKEHQQPGYRPDISRRSGGGVMNPDGA